MISQRMRTNLALGGLGLAAVAAVGIATGTDTLLGRGFGRALEAPRPGLTLDSTAARERAQTAATGDEGFWLTRAEVESPAPFSKPLAIGDRITIAGRDGAARQLEVVDLKSLGGHVVRTGSDQLRLQLVTCRVVGDGAEASTVRFIVEAAPAPAAPAPAKSL